MDSMDSPINLAKVLGLQPLDRLQLSNAQSLRRFRDEAHMTRTGPRQSAAPDLPYWFFRRIVGDELEVSSPSGYVARISPSEVCDILKGFPVCVLAMTKSSYVAWNSLLPAQRREKFTQGATNDYYSPAKIIGAQKGVFGFSFEVLFDDEALNADRSTFSPLTDESQKFAVAHAKSTIMPISGGFGYSADKGVALGRDKAQAMAKAFYAAALGGCQAIKTQALEVGDGKFSMPQANRLLADALKAAQTNLTAAT